MNVGQLRAFVEREIRWAPDAESHKKDLTSVIDAELRALVDIRNWPFAVFTEDFPIYVTVEGGASYAATFTNGSFVVSLTTGSTNSTWLGHTIIGPDGNAYQVVRVASSTDLAVEPAYAGSTVAASTSWSLQFRRYLMPTRTSDILALKDVDRNVVLDARTRGDDDAGLILEQGDEGLPLAFFPANVEQLEAPATAPTLVRSGTTSSLAANTTYRYFYTRYGKGLESGPSPVAEIATTSDKHIALSNLEVDAANSGYYRRVYRETNKSGAWRLVATLAETTATLNDPGLANGDRYDPFGQQREGIRLWPTPTEAATLKLTHKKHPPQLVAETDVPAIPVAYHEVLGWLAVQRLVGRMKDVPQKEQQRVERAVALALQRMFNRAMGETAQQVVLSPYRAERKGVLGRVYEGIRASFTWNGS